MSWSSRRASSTTATRTTTISLLVQVQGRRHLVVPYTPDTNDFRFWRSPGLATASQFFEYLKDSFDTLYAEGARRPRMMSVGLHPRQIGRPGGLSWHAHPPPSHAQPAAHRSRCEHRRQRLPANTVRQRARRQRPTALLRAARRPGLGRDATALAAVTYWKMAPDIVAAERTSTAGGMAHACEFETSLMLHHHPHLVRMEIARDERADEYSAHRRQDLFGGGPVMAPDHFADLTRSGVVGDPSRATAENGRSWSEAVSTRLADLIGRCGRGRSARRCRAPGDACVKRAGQSRDRCMRPAWVCDGRHVGDC